MKKHEKTRFLPKIQILILHQGLFESPKSAFFDLFLTLLITIRRGGSPKVLNFKNI